MIKTLKVWFSNISALFFFFLFFLSIFIGNKTFLYFEQLNRCFPLSIISSDYKKIDTLTQKRIFCNYSVENENFAIDSDIFKDREYIPLKTIWILKATAKKDTNIKNSEDLIVEKNPYLMNVVNNFFKQKFRIMIFFFIFSLGVLILSSKQTLFKIKTKTGLVFSISIILFIYLLASIFFKKMTISTNFLPVFYIIIVSGIIFHLTFQLLNAVFLKKK